MTNPTITANPKTGEVITMFVGKDKKNYGRIRVDSTMFVINNNMERLVRRSALITIPADVLALKADQLVEGAEYKVAGKTGKLKVVESVTPFYDAQEPKTRGSEGSVITSGGMPVFRDTLFTIDLNELDVLLPSDSEDTVPVTTPATALETNEAQE